MSEEAYKDEEKLREMHHNDELSQTQIGEKFDVTSETIRYYLKKFDIEIRTKYGNGYSKIDLARELRRVANKMGQTPTIWDMDQHSRYSHFAYQNNFESYHYAVEMAGLERNRKEMATVACDNCGTELHKPVSKVERSSADFCSLDCKHDAGRKTVVCANCGEEYDEIKAKVESQDNLFCCRDCWIEHISMEELGDTHSYGAIWREKTRQEALERDGYECVVCGISNQEHKEKYNQGLHIHHVHRAGDFESRDESDVLSNLVTLCGVDHRKWEGIPVRPH